MTAPVRDPRYISHKKPLELRAEKVYVGLLKLFGWPHLRRPLATPRTFQSILIIRHNMLGDAVAASVLIQALRAQYPDARISVLASPYNREAFTWIPGVHDIHVWPKEHRARWGLIKALKGRFDLVFQTLFDENYGTRTLAARIIAQRGVLVGRARNTPLQTLMDHAVELPAGSYAGKLLALMTPLCGMAADQLVQAHPRYLVNFTEQDKAEARAALAQAGVRRAFVLVNISAREPFRSLGNEQALRVIRDLIAAGQDVVISCVPHEMNRALALRQQAPGAMVARFPGLGPAMAAVAQASLYVGPDTGTVHFAAACGIPCLVLFAAIARPDTWSPYGTSFISLQATPGQEVSAIPADVIVERAMTLLEARESLQIMQTANPIHFPCTSRQAPTERSAVKLVKTATRDSS